MVFYALRHRERHCEAGQKQSGGLFLASLRAAMLRRAQGPQNIKLKDREKVTGFLSLSKDRYTILILSFLI